MDFWNVITNLTESVWTWISETNGNLLTFEVALLVAAGYFIINRGRWKWSSEAYASSFTNTLMILINGALAPVFVILIDVAEATYGSFSIPSLDSAIWNQVPIWASVPLVLLAIDLADYWNHRLMHASRWFWPIHAIHHSDPHLTVLSTGRVHLLEPFVMQVSYLILLTWLSLPYEVLGSLAGIRILHNMYVHMDVSWDHGPFKYLIASPRFHRWHHADEPACYGMNLANIFPFLDVIFRTYYVPGKCDLPIGAQGVPTTALDMVAWPFQEWNRLLTPKYRALIRNQTVSKTTASVEQT